MPIEPRRRVSVAGRLVRRWWGVPLFGAIVGSSAACSAKNEPEADEASAEGVAITCVEVKRQPLDRWVDLRGRVAARPGADLPLASQVAGRVVEVRVTEGARIEKGRVIALVDDLAPRAAASEAYAALARARAAKLEAEALLERTRKLEAGGVLSKADLESAQAKFDAAKADVAAQEAAVGLASGTLGRIEVRSPFDGVVTSVVRGNGALVDGTAATPIVEVAADEELEFVADATEKDLALVATGAKADVTLSSDGTKLTGAVVTIPQTVDARSGLALVRIALAATTEGPSIGSVRLGAFGHVRVHAAPIPDALSVPREALRGAILDGAEVAVCAHGKAAIHKIVVGYRDAERLQVISGLEAGDAVAVGDVLALSEGTPITEPPAAGSATPSGSAP